MLCHKAQRLLEGERSAEEENREGAAQGRETEPGGEGKRDSEEARASGRGGKLQAISRNNSRAEGRDKVKGGGASGSGLLQAVG
ncbi:hypothetical protein L7F22_065040, partial [Adiantum nelumboides]|nr:hypothetical protein [Adiantum nelumboides]